MKDYEVRRAQGLDVLRTLTKADDPESIAEALEAENGALGSFAIDFLLGDIWTRPQLNRRDRSLVVLAILGSLHMTESLVPYVRGAVNHGLTSVEIRETFILMSAYAGFPRAFAAMAVANQVLRDLGLASEADRLPPAARLSQAERLSRGAEVIAKIAGSNLRDPEQILTQLVGNLGAMHAYGVPYGFGDVWSRPELSRRDRSLVVVSILATLGRSDELKIHIGAAFRHGVNRVELDDLMLTVFGYAGAPLAVEGMRVLVEIATHFESVEQI